MKKLASWCQNNVKIVVYCGSLILIGIACSAIHWPSGMLVVGGLLWLDLFITDLIVQIKIDHTGRREDDVRSRAVHDR